MATKKAAPKAAKAKAAKVNEESEVVDAALLESLGIASDLDVTPTGAKWRTINVEKRGFQLKDGDNGNHAVQAFDAIIVHQHPLRTYYASKEMNGTPPDCSSIDGVTGSAFGDCAGCEHNYNNAMKAARAAGQTKPHGETCKEKHALYVKTEVDQPAWLIRVPTMSLGAVNLYAKILKTAGKAPIQVWTRFTSVLRKNKGGIEYGEINCAIARDVKKTELLAIVPEAKMLAAADNRPRALPERVASSDESFA